MHFTLGSSFPSWPLHNGDCIENGGAISRNTSGIIHRRRYTPSRWSLWIYVIRFYLLVRRHIPPRSILLRARPCSSRSRVTPGSFSTRIRREIRVQTLHASARSGKHAPREGGSVRGIGGTCNFHALAFPGAITFREWRASFWRPDEFRRSTGRNIA